MARTIDSETPIAASATRVWDELVDFARYGEWNPFLVAVAGSPVAGERLLVTFSGADGRTFRFRPRLIVVEAPSRLEWRATTGVRGVFDVQHTLAVTALDRTHCRLVNRERFSGVAVAAVWKFIAAEHAAGLQAMNEALRGRCGR